MLGNEETSKAIDDFLLKNDVRFEEVIDMGKTADFFVKYNIRHLDSDSLAVCSYLIQGLGLLVLGFTPREFEVLKNGE